MRVVLDTNRYVDLMKGLSRAVEVLGRVHEILVPFVVLGELRAGFLQGNQGRKNEARLTAFLAQPGVSVAHSTEATTRTYSLLFRQLRSAGTPIPTNDIWIAALTVENDAALFSRDQHFDHLPQLARVDG